MQNFETESEGTNLTHTEWNNLASEVKNIVPNTGQTFDPAKTDQLERAISIYAAGGIIYTDSGSANSYVLSPVGSKKAPHTYFNGMRVLFKAGTTNTGASTINIASLGSKSIVRLDGSTLNAGDITINYFVHLIYDPSADNFKLLERIPMGNLVGTIDSQTLENKTLVTPTINGLIGGTPAFSNPNTKVSAPVNSVQSILSAKADGTLIDQDFYISPWIDISSGLSLQYGGGTLDTVNRAKASFKRLGTKWSMVFNIMLQLSNATRTNAYIAMANIAFEMNTQAISGYAFNSGLNLIYALAGNESFQCAHASGSTNYYVFSGDILLAAKPTYWLPAGA